MVDVIYTPPNLAAALVSLSSKRDVLVIADFCAGDGQLLRAAKQRWPRARLVATDLHMPPMRAVQEELNLGIGRCDFTQARSRGNCHVLRGLAGLVDIVLLNPPFSHRGGRVVNATLGNEVIRASPALSVVIAAAPYVKSKGEILAVLPIGCLRSHKNEHAWNALRVRFAISVEAFNDKRIFKRCVPKTALVRLTKRSKEVEQAAASVVERKGATWFERLHRGNVAMHRFVASKHRQAIPFVHTTDLHDHLLGNVERRVAPHGRCLRGTFVLIPRVGAPQCSKIVIAVSEGMILSDCVIAVACDGLREASAISLSICRAWPAFASLYRGTGAPYVTLRDIAAFLESARSFPASDADVFAHLGANLSA